MKTDIVSASFLSDNDLYNVILNIIRGTKKQLMIVSPFIKLNTRIKNELEGFKDDLSKEIIVIIGKNSDKIEKSLSIEDLDYLKSFPHIDIAYLENLHAKYYSNERYQLICSMNLYDFSTSENYESGLLLDFSSIYDTITDKVYKDSSKYFWMLYQKSESIFYSEPQYEKGFFSKKILEGQFESEDNSDLYYGNKTKVESKVEEKEKGYCIRTGVKIPFNLERPYSRKGFKFWNKNESEPEYFCHFSGEPSNGENSFKRPVLRKNWNKIK